MIVTFDELRFAARRALAAADVAPGIEEQCGWACAWLEACSYPGLTMLFEALDETPREERRPVYGIDALGLDLRQISCIFSAPKLVELAAARTRIFLRNVKHGLYVLPFAVKANIAIGCPVDPSFAIGGERHKNPYEEKLSAAAQTGIAVDSKIWMRVSNRT